MGAMEPSWHALSSATALDKLGSGERGLAPAEALGRLERYGLNALPEEKPRSPFALFFAQFRSPLIYVLLAASAIIFAIGEPVDGSIILAILFFNAVVGMIQEGKAQHALRALKTFVRTNATVLREGEEFIIADREVVPGDVILIQAGEKIPADARIMLSQNLKIDESSLTGEAEPVNKIADALSSVALVTADQKNMVFKGTNAVAGSATAVVVATGLSTVIGKIAKQISAIDTEVPLKANIRSLSRAIIVIAASLSAAIFVIGIASGHSVKEMFTTVVSLSVSIIPEGLPIVMTLVLATGVWRMSKRHALVKKLQAVEALGQARVIAVDKTGTITKNELVVRAVLADGALFRVGGSGYEPSGDITRNGVAVDPAMHEGLLILGRASTLFAAARLSFAKAEREWRIAGDPTEAAALVFGEKLGFRKDEVLIESPLIAEIPFDYALKYHATVHGAPAGPVLTVAGAPEVVLALSTRIHLSGKEHTLSKQEAEALEAEFITMSSKGLRVLAVAVRRGFHSELTPGAVGELSFIGFLGMQDTLRDEVADALRRAEDAGIRVVMVTGDHKVTARAIAAEAGVYHEGDGILTGAEIDELYDAELAKRLATTSVFARVTPEHKMRIITAYKNLGEVVAMTGDGVNDAPSLVAADLGVAMGKIGTEVAKEAADIVLLDDNFGSIISAIEEGKSIYRTIKKVVLYLFSTSLGEVLTITAALLLGYPLPLLAAQIIWLNFVTDGFLDVALAMEPKERGLLSERFARPARYLVDRLMAVRMLVMAVTMMLGTLFLFREYVGIDFDKALTISLTTLAVFQWFNAWNCRSETRSIFAMNPLSNRFLIGATAIVIMLQILAVYTPFLQGVLHTVPLALSDWLIIIPVAASIIVAEEARKFLARRVAPAV